MHYCRLKAFFCICVWCVPVKFSSGPSISSLYNTRFLDISRDRALLTTWNLRWNIALVHLHKINNRLLLAVSTVNFSSLSLSLSNPDLKLICFLLLAANYSTYLFCQRICSRLTALWRYINFILLLLVSFSGQSDCLPVDLPRLCIHVLNCSTFVTNKRTIERGVL